MSTQVQKPDKPQYFDTPTRELSPAELLALARIAGYKVEDRTPETDAPGRMVRFSAVKSSDGIERTRGTTANEAWASFMLLYWNPTVIRNQCYEVVSGITDKVGLTEIGRQLHIQYTLNRKIEDHAPFAWAELAAFLLMSTRRQLQAVLECPTVAEIVEQAKKEIKSAE